MTKSLITRCPKCSTAFRVNDDVLSMAKGKVRCGQCFHIFNATQHAAQATQKNQPTEKNNSPQPSAAKEQPETTKAVVEENNVNTIAKQPKTPQQKDTSTPKAMLFTSADEEPVNSEWLQTLFSEDDLSTASTDKTSVESKQPDPIQDITRAHKNVDESTTSSPIERDTKETRQNGTTETKPTNNDDLDPWERELAEIEQSIANSTSSQTVAPKEGSLKNLKQSDIQDRIEDTLDALDEEPEPDYMIALHSLAQSASEQNLPTTPNSDSQHYSSDALHSLSATATLDPLLGEYHTEQTPKKSSKTWLWIVGTLLGLLLLLAQVSIHFFKQGSNSETFRTFYRTFCTYTGCTLAPYENIKAIGIQHVRIQSHPTQPGALLVNAIMTNNSRFSQPMPKIALEFFDLNGAPVAARLFSPKDYLDKDFLDITYMPPNTPIHIVIPIQDPGDRAVTHQLRIFPSNTRSY